eukprot:4690319-Karenia_brevis.AAC.1
MLKQHIDPTMHNILAGDFNFVERDTDRFIKSSCTWSAGEDRQANKELESIMAQFRMREWRQEMMT